MTATTYERELAARGRPIGRCPVDGRVFDAGTDYLGRPHAPHRDACSLPCRDRLTRDRSRVRRAHRREFAELIRLHEQEAAGQIPLVDDPLPPVPPIEGVEVSS